MAGRVSLGVKILFFFLYFCLIKSTKNQAQAKASRSLKMLEIQRTTNLRSGWPLISGQLRGFLSIFKFTARPLRA
jgi:hypothetical protein